ncbi:MAG: outer membrane lipoprotein-sorting protein [Verrucomicrobiota bacterium]|nr:outer membrane lipoprotein-sorting protein [Verrucomicrobiota bacterium]
MPPIDFVMGRFWRNLSLHSADMKGILRTPTKVYKMNMRTTDREILMEVPEAGLAVQVNFSSAETKIKRGKIGSTLKTLTGKEKSEKILDTDISYEDLGLTFLNWTEVTEIGTDDIKTLPAYTYEAIAPKGQSGYSKVRYWISSEYFSMLRADAMDANNKIIKRVQVNGVMKVQNAWVIREMQISTFSPGRTTSKSRTYLEILSAKINES